MFTKIICRLLYDCFQQNSHQNDAIGPGNESVTSVDLENVGQGHISQSNNYYQTDLNKMFFMNDDAPTGIVALMYAGPHFFTLDNCLLYMDAAHKLLNYLRFTHLV